MKVVKRISGLLSVGVLFSYQLFAGGFQVNLQGQKQTGMAHTGVGLPLDNAALVLNPGALIFVDSLGSFSAGASFIIPRTIYLDPNSTYIAQP
jgi:long-chain fatty acid transport protein